MLYSSIQAVSQSGHKIVLIGTSKAAPEYTVNENDFAELAVELGCPFFCDAQINQLYYERMIEASGAEVAISINWLTLIKQTILDKFKYGLLNAHAGDLPRYRGNAVPNWAILAGESEVVATIHQMVAQLDAGPILLKRSFPLSSNSYIFDVYRFLETAIPEMFVHTLSGLENGTIVPTPQPEDPALALRCFPRIPQDGQIDWQLSAVEIGRLIRASAEPFAGAYSYLGDEKTIIWRAYPESLPYSFFGVPGQVVEIRHQTGEVVVLAADGIVVLEEIETAKDGRIRPNRKIKSTRTRFGLDIAQLLERIVILEKQITQLKEA